MSESFESVVGSIDMFFNGYNRFFLFVDVEMDGEKRNKSLKPIGKKLKKKFKMGMKNRRSKGVLRGKRV